MNLKLIKELKIGELFSFSKKGAVHMVSSIKGSYIEYKSYSDGKIRIEYTKRENPVYPRPEWDSLFEHKWFLNIE
jgi:hypothetical protein